MPAMTPEQVQVILDKHRTEDNARRLGGVILWVCAHVAKARAAAYRRGESPRSRCVTCGCRELGPTEPIGAI